MSTQSVNGTMFKSKIHRATVTHVDLHYVGSVTIDQDLLDAADILPGEQVAIVDITKGARLETYTIAGERGCGVVGINGAAAHLAKEGDMVIIISYSHMMDEKGQMPRSAGSAHGRRQQDHWLGGDPSEALTAGLQRPPGSHRERTRHRW